MYQTINESDFIRAFDQMDRSEDFSIPARRALFDFFEEMEEGSGESQELDVIAICCDFAEMDEQEIREEYGHIDGITDADDLDEIAEILRDETLVIHTGDNYTLVIQGF